MDFNFSDDQNSLREAVAKWVEKGFDFPRRHALAKAGGKTRAVYAELAELGLTGLAIPEAYGGMSFGATEAMVVMEELGRGLVNAPFAAAALVTPTLLSAAPPELQAAWLPRIATADALVVPALQERSARYRLNHVTTTATQTATGWVLSGQKSVVPAADEADAFVVPARISGGADDSAGIGLFLVEKGAAGVSTTGYPTQDGGRAGELMLDKASAALVTTEGWAVLQQAVDVGIAATCAEGVGLMDKMMAITVEYMNIRKQFGVTLASFQALRHRIADVKMAVELGRSMSFYASLKLGEAPEQRRRSLSQAKVQLGNSMRQVGQYCTQIHGGIGVTDEYISSHYFKRLTMLEMAYGDTLHHLGEVSVRMQDTAGVFA
jgi:alkylation response protein AidB-like acyl-CoA dehydrogenase